MHRRVHPLPGKRITKNEIRQIEFNDENAEVIRHSSKSAISLNIILEDNRKKSSSFFKPKWMRSSDEGQKVSRMVTIKRWLLKSTRPKHHKKKTSQCFTEQLIVNECKGLDNPGFIEEEIEERIVSCTLEINVPVCDLPLVDIVSGELNETVVPEEHLLDIDFSRFEILSGLQDNHTTHGLCSLSSVITIPAFDPRCLSPTRSILPPSEADEGERCTISSFSGESTEKANELYDEKYNEQSKLLTKRLLRKERRNVVLMKRLWDMTGTLMRQSRTITVQDKCIESLDQKLSKLESQRAKKKEKPVITNVYNVEYVDLLTITSERNN